METLLREPVAGDIGWLIAVHGALYAEQFDFDARFERDIAEKVVRFFAQRNTFNRILIALVDGERAGSVAVSLRRAHTAFVNFLLVVPQCRNRGIGRRMLEETITYSMEHGLERIRLETYSCLKAARKLYSRLGFAMYQRNENLHMYGQTFDQEYWEKRISSVYSGRKCETG